MKRILLTFLLLTVVFVHSQNDEKRGTITVKRNPIFEFERGERLFKENCSGCHTSYPYDKDERVYVTYLKNVTTRRSPSWLFNFMRYPELLLKSGDTAVIKINKKIKWISDRYSSALVYRSEQKTHPSFHYLSLSQINAVFFYVDSLSTRKEYFLKGQEIDGHK